MGVLHLTNLDSIIYCIPKGCTIVNFDGDRYDFEPPVSLKQEEHEKWSQSGSSARTEYEPYNTLEVRDWELISQNMRDKANLLNYIGNSWMKKQCALLSGSKGRACLVVRHLRLTSLDVQSY